MAKPFGVALVLFLVVFQAGSDEPKTKTLPPAAAQVIDYSKDIEPIFARECFSCHGEKKQRSSFRLDRRAEALQGGDHGVVIVSGQSEKSFLVQLIAGLDPNLVMPPGPKRLTPVEIGLIRAWIDQGTKYPDAKTAGTKAAETWWSFRPLVRPVPPKVPDKLFTVRNAIDAFVLGKLREQKLEPSPESDRRTLIRRVYFDLIGLAPTFSEIAQFEKDASPDAYEKVVERLLASPQYGERWARHWLDLVHFGESHGYDKDKPRFNAWPYRDYVIQALNKDTPFHRFVQEQFAGDVLFPGTVAGVEALGFLAAGPWDFIGHAEVPESRIDGKITRHLDRDDMIANTMGAFTSMTVSCAQCHNHKFDPITMEDYYSLHAVFAAIDRTDKRYYADPKLMEQRLALEKKQKSLEGEMKKLEDLLKERGGAELARFEPVKALPPGQRPAAFGYHSGIARSNTEVKWVQVDLGQKTPIAKIDYVGCHDDFNNIGAGFGFPLRFKIEASDDAFFASGVTILADHTGQDFPNPGTRRLSANVSHAARYVRLTATKLMKRQNDFNFALAELSVFDGDGNNLARGKTVTAFDSIEALPRWSKKNLVDGLFAMNAANDGGEIQKQRQALIERLLSNEEKSRQAALQKELAATSGFLAKMPSPQVVYAGAIHTGGGAFAGTGPFGGKPRPIHLLTRGDVRKPGAEVGPGALSLLKDLPARFELPKDHNEGERRAALARWITDSKNVLTWRSIVNRVWLHHFGRGIVDTPNDFGKMGQLPTHPELLDWLAVEFRDGGQSLKHLHRLMVTSSTYRQSSASRPEFAKVDSGNQYYWRMNRRKLEAEAIRDSVLSLAGKLNLTMGGPSFQDFRIEKPEHSPHYQYHLHDPEDPKSHRRSIYRFIVRSQQQPFMATFDCADPSLQVEKRNQTITPQQALALLNNQLLLSMAKHFSERVKEAEPAKEKRAAAAFRLALGREPTAREAEVLTRYAAEHGLANACRVVMNLNEFVFVD